jgi:hypothetical protein
MEVGTFGGEGFGHMMAYESGGACYKNFHQMFSGSILNRGFLLDVRPYFTNAALPIEAIWANDSFSRRTSAGRSHFQRK